MPDLTPTQVEHLRKIAAAEADVTRFDGLPGRAIARILWPDSDAWNRVTRSRPGFNGAMGGTMPMKGARAARILVDAGMMHIEYTRHHQALFRVSDRGRRYLEDHPATAGGTQKETQ